MKELFKTYFKIDGEIINGYKITEKNGRYFINVYTSCEKLGNWQEFLYYDDLNKVINYFKKSVARDIEGNQKSEWAITENEWRKHTLKLLLDYKQNNLKR